jgi:hypothetical protein
MTERRRHLVYILVYPDGTVGFTTFTLDKDYNTGKLIWRQGAASCGGWSATIEKVKRDQKYPGITTYKIIRLPKFPS